MIVPEHMLGFQVIIEVVGPKGAAVTEVMHNVGAEQADRLMRRWHAPNWMRWGCTLTLDWVGADSVTIYRWSDVLSLRIQPELEVYRP